MGIPESQLDTWAHQGAIAQSRDTYATIKAALESRDAGYAGKDYAVFLQGSYGNDTNIYAESDVDIVIRLDSLYYYDIAALSPQEQLEFRGQVSPVTYDYATFKGHVVDVLEKRFGREAVKVDTRAVKIKAANGRRSADVLVACEFQKYHARNRSSKGICFFTSNGVQIENYPRQHSDNCTTKHQASAQWFKPMVRILKNMRTKLVNDGVIARGTAPSYYIEGLLYNVPNNLFGSSYADTFTRAVNWIHQADRTQFLCANEHYYLLRDNVETCWPTANGELFLQAVTKLWNNW